MEIGQCPAVNSSSVHVGIYLKSIQGPNFFPKLGCYSDMSRLRKNDTDAGRVMADTYLSHLDSFFKTEASSSSNLTRILKFPVCGLFLTAGKNEKIY